MSFLQVWDILWNFPEALQYAECGRYVRTPYTSSTNEHITSEHHPKNEHVVFIGSEVRSVWSPFYIITTVVFLKD